MSYTTSLSFDLSPVRLSYVEALRGVEPRRNNLAFTYAQTGDFDPESLICLAASNPEGHFYGVMESAQNSTAASVLAGARQVWNVSFSNTVDILPSQLDYLAHINTQAVASEEVRNKLCALAAKHLKDGGTFVYRYKAYENEIDTLRFLIEEYAPELSPQQAKDFLTELKQLGPIFFDKNPALLHDLNKAIAAETPDAYFDSITQDKTYRSGAFDTMAAILPLGFASAGDADIQSNYLELAAPASAHDLLIKCRDHLLYESIKDFVLCRTIRNDVWVKTPVKQTADRPTLFGHFTFGITALEHKVPSQYEMNGKTIDLSTPLFQSLINVMCLLPMSVGDFLSHPAGKGFDPEDVLSSIQVLVAIGIAQPMRGRYEGHLNADTANPQWSNGFNAFLKQNEISTPIVRLASPIVGGAVSLPAKEALVLQALSRVGLSNISGSLQPELQLLAKRNPELAFEITNAQQPSDEVVHAIVTKVLEQGMVRWYAYGLLAA